MTNVLEALKSARFLLDAKGEEVAVQLSMAAWEALLDWIEEQEDLAIVKAAIPQLKQLREASDSTEWLDWDVVKEQWDSD